MISQEQAENIVQSLIVKFKNTFKQELAGENEEILPRVMLEHKSIIARYSWKSAQQWCKWDDSGPILMPDFTRIYYRKGNTEILLQEFQPQIRLMKFKGRLCNRSNSESPITDDDIHYFSLAVPYVIFLFKFEDGMYKSLQCAFSDRPLKRLDEQPLRPYLSNLDSNLKVCLGHSFDVLKLEKNNLTQQSSFILDHFWNSAYSDEYSGHFWSSKKHFESSDQRLSDLKNWQEASYENSLFVVEDVNWLKHTVHDSFGDMIVDLLIHDKQNDSFENELYDSLSENFLSEFKTSLSQNIDNIDEYLQRYVKKWAAELLTEINR